MRASTFLQTPSNDLQDPLVKWLDRKSVAHAQLIVTQSAEGSQPHRKAVFGRDLTPSPRQMISRDSGSQTCFKRRGKVILGDEVSGPNLLCINTVYV